MCVCVCDFVPYITVPILIYFIYLFCFVFCANLLSFAPSFLPFPPPPHNTFPPPFSYLTLPSNPSLVERFELYVAGRDSMSLCVCVRKIL